jgi:hypothetical protein
VNLLALLGALLHPRLRSRLLHLALGCANLLARLVNLPARFLRLRALLAVLLNLGVQVLAVPNPLLLEVPEALAELIQILSLETIPVL